MRKSNAFQYVTRLCLAYPPRALLIIGCLFVLPSFALAWGLLTRNPSDDLSDEPIRPIPIEISLDEDKVNLGEKLFYERRLSKNNNISCADCHDLSDSGTDGIRFYRDIEGKRGPVNTPTVFNAAFNFRQFWNGGGESLEDKIDTLVTSSDMMGSVWPEIIEKLREDEDYTQAFLDVFNGQITPERIRSALVEFERSLTTPNSRFDQFLRGNDYAIDELEKEGYQKFKDYGCISCHNGVNVGGNMYQILGVMNPYFNESSSQLNDADKGRYALTGRNEDMHLFKVPSLRMVSRTAPYLHDGSISTLRSAVDVMFNYQLGIEPPERDKDAIVAFLKTLAGEYTRRSK